MKVSAFTIVTKPEERQDPWRESISSVLNWADEVVVVCGDSSDQGLIHEHFLSDKIKYVHLYWPEDWSWEELPKHLNAGLAECTGDWAIKFDIDYVFPEDFAPAVRNQLALINDCRIATFQKLSTVLSTKLYQKGGIPLGINLKHFSGTAFGEATNKETDLCYPIVQSGINKKGIPQGTYPDKEVGRTGLTFFNYDYTFKTMDFVAKEFFRFSKAYERYFGSTPWGHSEDESLSIFTKMMSSRLAKCPYIYPWPNHPRWVSKKVRDIKADQFGYNGWGLL